MKKHLAMTLGFAMMAMGGCVSMNVAGGGNLGDTDLGANVDSSGSVGVNAGKSLKAGDTETEVGVSSDGNDTNVNTDTQYNPDSGE